MEHNLVPPFLLREAGLNVNDIPKIHVKSPDVQHHSIYFENADLRIPLALWGVFSYFPSRFPTIKELQSDKNEVLLLTPNGPWDPHSDVYARNEENMTDWLGNISEPEQRPRILLKTVEEDVAMSASLCISSVETQVIDSLYDSRRIIGSATTAKAIPHAIDDDRHLQDVDPALVASTLASTLSERASVGQLCASIGATEAHLDAVLFPDLVEDNINLMGQLDLDKYEYILSSTAEVTNTRGVSAEHLSKVWRIDMPTAARTLEVTSQRCVHAQGDNLNRNYSTNDHMLRYRRIDQHFFMHTFFATKKSQHSSRGHTCMQLFVTDKGFAYVVPMRTKGEVSKAIKLFAKEIGAPDAIICDAAREQISREVRSFCTKMGTALRALEEDTLWANRAELYIGLVKETVCKDMKESDCPLAFWDYCTERRVQVHNLTASSLFQLDGCNPHFSVTGQEGDISNLCQSKWYEWVYYREGSANFPLPHEVLGRTLGPAKGEGNEMAQWCLKANGNVVPQRTVRSLSPAKLSSDTEIRKREVFTELVTTRWGTYVSPPTDDTTKDDYDFDEYEDDDEKPLLIPKIDDPIDVTGRAIDSQPAYNRMINTELMLPQNGEYQPVTVIGRTVSPSGRPEGQYHEDPAMNSMTYDVQLPDGDVKEYAANIIAENLLNQIDDEGFSTTMVESVVDHRKTDAAVNKDDMYTVSHNGTKRIRQTTCGWQLLVKWKDSSKQWVPLSFLKESNPVDVAEYAKARGGYTPNLRLLGGFPIPYANEM
jgi:hypothetical protein